ncbi:MAG: glycosyltransferase [Culicoidibacterales bacterium]
MWKRKFIHVIYLRGINTNMKKIAILVGHLDIGGVQKITVDLANNLSGKYEITLVSVYRGNVDYEVVAKHDSLNVNLNPYNIICTAVGKFVTKNFEFAKKKELQVIKEYFNSHKYDAIIASDGYMTMFLANIDISYSVKKIGWMHNEYKVYLNSYYASFKKNFIKSLSDMNQVVVLTKEDKIIYQKHNSKTTTIYNPLTLSTSKVSNLAAKEIVFVGRISREQKGLDLLLDILARTELNEWKLRIVGDGKDFGWLKKEVEKKDLKDKVILNGVVKENIDEVYAAASIFVSTSRWEGFGLVITEAMSCGLPVITFENTGPKEILGNGKYGIIIPKYDIEMFAKELSNLIKNKKELCKYQNLSLQRSRDFQKSKIIQEWERIINEE